MTTNSNSNALTVLLASLNEEQRALYDQATAAAAPSAAPAAAAGPRTYSLDEIAAVAKALGMQGPGAAAGSPSPAPAPMPGPPNVVSAGPPVTSRGTPPPSHTITDDTPILSMSIPDREALRQKLGDVRFAERHLKELGERRVKVRARTL